jgi:phage-related protein
MKKKVRFDKRAEKDFLKLPREVQLEFRSAIEVLQEDGELREPLGKKMEGQKDLYEMRIRHKGQWRALYSYIPEDNIIVLHVFRKKSQKTPKNDLDTAKNRLKSIK